MVVVVAAAVRVVTVLGAVVLLAEEVAENQKSSMSSLFDFGLAWLVVVVLIASS